MTGLINQAILHETHFQKTVREVLKSLQKNQRINMENEIRETLIEAKLSKIQLLDLVVKLKAEKIVLAVVGDDYCRRFEQDSPQLKRELVNLVLNALRDGERITKLRISNNRSLGGVKGAKGKHSSTRQLKDWGLQEAKKIKGHSATKARELMKRLPPQIAKILKSTDNPVADPERVLRDALTLQLKQKRYG